MRVWAGTGSHHFGTAAKVLYAGLRGQRHGIGCAMGVRWVLLCGGALMGGRADSPCAMELPAGGGCAPGPRTTCNFNLESKHN